MWLRGLLRSLAHRNQGWHAFKLLLITALLFASASIFLLGQSASAQSRLVQGLQLPVQEVSSVDGKNSRVTISGKVFLVPTADVETLLLQQSLSRADIVAKISLAGLIDFTNRALESTNIAWLDLGVQALLMHPALMPAQLVALLSDGAMQPQYMAALKKWAKKYHAAAEIKPTIKIPVFFEIGVADPEWVRDNLLSSVLSLKDQFGSYAKDAFLLAIQAKHFERLATITQLLRALFGVEDTLFQELRLITERIGGFQAALKKRDIAAIEIALLSFKNHQNIDQIVFPYFVDQIHRVSREDADQGKHGTAIRLLSQVDLSFRTNTTHELLQQSLEKLSDNDLMVLDQPGVRRYLLSLLQYDPAIKDRLISHYESKFLAFLSVSDFTSVDRSLDGLLELRPDPNAANDSLRIGYARALREQGYLAQSKSLLSEVRTGTPILTRLDVQSFDYFGIPLFLSGCTLLSGVLFFALVAVRLSNMRAARVAELAKVEALKRREALETATEESEDDEFERPAFKPMKKISPERKEYIDSLSLFNLPPDASFKDIKQAYRTAVKTHHPDMHGEGMASNKFVDLTQTYDRILELREIIGMKEE